jgi:hypothetical protein
VKDDNKKPACGEHKMMRLLTQIMAGFLSIGAGFLGAYLVYPYSTQATIDHQIQVEGLKIIEIPRSPPEIPLTGNPENQDTDMHFDTEVLFTRRNVSL